ncbi:NUDIX hydrolase [Phyllobacterium myrsinacearum]|uniref:8-oxo-dGTP pyrophosphatase MutT (NUDIX family) n=1 Tax=Phyllobacterium myrsinacearum TaxID=28101 RepID=A0A839EMC4_9HYPH|nr:NUDIX hydrolase [Phyllobacterium myrsinacearum]MBA8878644.1 8-oxo-dGTP pyrophosphatase MutT (NUDIX family) [Phyllobacterium myrsinacearum]
MLDVPEETVIPITRAVVRVEEGPLAYVVAHRDAIAANWIQEVSANPALFDGSFFMAEQAEIDDGIFHAVYKRTTFATMMHWKRNASSNKPWHIFGVGVIVSSDNQLIAGQMGTTTSAAGRVYFPAGSFDANDLVGDQVDFDGNALREVAEETGLDLAEAGRRDATPFLVKVGRSIAVFRRYYFPRPADELLAAIRATIASQAEPELDGVCAISAAGEMGEATPRTFSTFADWHFTP